MPILLDNVLGCCQAINAHSSWKRGKKKKNPRGELSVNSFGLGNRSLLQVESWAKVELDWNQTGWNTWSLFNGFVQLQRKQIPFGNISNWKEKRKRKKKIPMAHSYRLSAEKSCPLGCSLSVSCLTEKKEIAGEAKKKKKKKKSSSRFLDSCELLGIHSPKFTFQ